MQLFIWQDFNTSVIFTVLTKFTRNPGSASWLLTVGFLSLLLLNPDPDFLFLHPLARGFFHSKDFWISTSIHHPGRQEFRVLIFPENLS